MHIGQYMAKEKRATCVGRGAPQQPTKAKKLNANLGDPIAKKNISFPTRGEFFAEGLVNVTGGKKEGRGADSRGQEILLYVNARVMPGAGDKGEESGPEGFERKMLGWGEEKRREPEMCQ